MRTGHWRHAGFARAIALSALAVIGIASVVLLGGARAGA